jgi:hypothetical protein
VGPLPGPDGCGKSRQYRCLECSKYSWYSFLLEAESIPGPQCGWKDYINKNSNDTIGNQSRDLPVCSAVSEPLRHRVPPYCRCILTFYLGLIMFLERRGRDSSIGTATGYGLDGPGIESRWRRDFPHLSIRAPYPHPASYTMGTESFPGVKRPMRDVDYPPHLVPNFKERVELHLYTPYGPSWPVIG